MYRHFTVSFVYVEMHGSLLHIPVVHGNFTKFFVLKNEYLAIFREWKMKVVLAAERMIGKKRISELSKGWWSMEAIQARWQACQWFWEAEGFLHVTFSIPSSSSQVSTTTSQC